MDLINLFFFSFILSGEVRDSNDKSLLPYASVWVEGTGYGVTADEQGRFRLYLSEGEYEIVASRIGYKENRLKIKLIGDKEIKIYLVPEPLEIEPVNVSASGYTLGGAGDGQVLTRLDILRSPGACADVFLVVKDLPSVAGESEIAPLWIRGGDPNEVLVLFNGVPLLHPYQLEGTGGGMFSLVNEEFLSIAEFLVGVFPPRYGGRMSGVFSLKTKESFSENGLHGRLGLNMAGSSLSLNSKRYYFSLAKNFYNYLAKFFDKNKGHFIVYPDFYTLQAGITPLNQKNCFLKSFAIVGGDKMSIDLTPQGYRGEYRSATQKMMIGSQLLASHKSLLFEFSGGVNIYSAKENFAEWKFYKDKKSLFCGLNLDWDIISRHTISTGGEFWLTEERIDYVVPEERYLITEGPTDTIKNKFSAPLYWWYIQSNSRVLSGNLVYGVRTGERKGKIALDPRISFSKKIIRDWIVFLGCGKHSQYPSLIEIEGRTELNPSYALHYIVGIEKTTSTCKFKLDTYYKSYRELIHSDTLDNYISKGYGDAKGIEMFVKWHQSNIKPYIGYALASARRTYNGSKKLAPFAYDIRHNFTLSVSSPRIMIKKIPFDIGIKFKYMSGKPYTPLIGREVKGDTVKPIWGEMNSERMPLHMRLDLRITTYGTLFKMPIIGFLEVLNTTDYQNIIWYSWNIDYTERKEIILMPRTIVGGFVLEF